MGSPRPPFPILPNRQSRCISTTDTCPTTHLRCSGLKICTDYAEVIEATIPLPDRYSRLAVAVIVSITSAEGTATVHAKIRWTAVVLTLLTTVVILAMFGSRNPDIPRKLPAITSEARPLSGGMPASVEIVHEPSQFYPADPMPVQVVSHNVPVAARLLLLLGANDQIVKLRELRDDAGTGTEPRHLIWTDEHLRDNKPIFVRSRDIRFKFDNDADLKISVNGTERTPSGGEYRLELEPGKNELKITAKKSTDEDSKPVTVDPSNLIIHAPDPANVRAPNITHLANGKNADLKPTPTSADPINLYGTPNVYLRIVGQNYPISGELTFLRTVGHNDRSKLEEISDSRYQLQQLDGGTWVAELRLPRTIASPNYLMVRSTSDGLHNYSKAIRFNIADRPPLTTKLRISKVRRKANAQELEQVPRTNQYALNEKELTLEVTLDNNFPEDSQVVIYRDGTILGKLDIAPSSQTSSVDVDVQGLNDGTQRLRAQIEHGDQQPLPTANSGQAVSDPINVVVRTTGPKVERVVPQNFGTAPGVRAFVIHFTPTNRLAIDAGKLADMIELRRSMGSGSFKIGIDEPIAFQPPVFDPEENTITVRLEKVPADLYQLTVRAGPEPFRDIFGNRLEGIPGRPGTDYVTVLGRTPPDAELAQEPSVRPGISGATGEYVAFPEFTRPRKVPDGFNPHDKVETRVVRLYYYRDAHRVAQIINRKVKSHNRQGVDTSRQLADKARSLADQASEARREAERAAILKAQETRRIETQLRSAEQNLNRSVQELTNARRQGAEAGEPVIVALETAVRRFSDQVDSLRTSVQHARGDEQLATEAATGLEGKERMAREEQFRHEVAAAHADPDTYAAGQPRSSDPVEQVSISVIGEGLIHLRGPLKGINTIRTMIDQIDQPVGQVRVAVHTVQINGERQNRMEDVANIIQMYLDHSRFLTMQSSEMLRKAVVQVAARKAEESMALYPGDSQRDRDRRYLDAFFGREFIDELEAMDSEFLRSGNKILSLHSMDTTSLSSALNLLALAKNSTRLEILAEFEQMTQGELPMIEAMYMEAAMTVCRQKWSMRHPPTFYPMAHRATFQSLKGFFNAQIAHDETLTPLQREFIRLAQIFKSRLITEMEYKQRVMERAMIEERGSGNYLEELRAARQKEDDAEEELEKVRAENAKVRQQVVTSLTETIVAVTSTDRRAVETFRELQAFKGLKDEIDSERNKRLIQAFIESRRPVSDKEFYWVNVDSIEGKRYQLARRNEQLYIVPAEGDLAFQELFSDAILKLRDVFDALSKFTYQERRFERARKLLGILEEYEPPREGPKRGEIEYQQIERAAELFGILWDLHAEMKTWRDLLREGGHELARLLGDVDFTFEAVLEKWGTLRSKIDSFFPGENPRRDDVMKHLDTVDEHMQRLGQASVRHGFAREQARLARRPLDHRKFLDMLIDDLEEKYIELLDGTRAHTANVDNYLKRLTTALDDDFNTQFYFPAFRYIREASTHWDVQFGQVETTSILANNRAFAKVDPSASMEFDLPARRIAIAEALSGAKALIDDVGALANDPSFLALASSGIVAPANISPGGAGGFGVVRDVLPGLDSTTAEQIMAHNAGARPQFGSNLENLIPDPAIYKFETGTGYEIRPVIQPDGQAVVFGFDYMYTTQIREPVRADEKRLGRVKRHFINTDVQLSNFELREVSRYTVALRASRTSRGVPMLENIPIAGVLFRPLPSAESSLQQNLIYSQATIFPTLFDLMGLRWAPAVADLDPLGVTNREFVVRGRQRALENRVYDFASEQVDEFLRIPQGNRRADLYRSQETIPYLHPNGYQGPGLDLHDSPMREGYRPEEVYPPSRPVPSQSSDGAIDPSGRSSAANPSTRRSTLDLLPPGKPDPRPALEPPAVQWREQ